MGIEGDKAIVRIVLEDSVLELAEIKDFCEKGQLVELQNSMDMTRQAETLYDFVNKTIDEELVEELSFLVNYDNTKKTIQDIIDMPDRLIDLFI